MKTVTINITDIPRAKKSRQGQKIVNLVMQFMNSDAPAVEVLLDENEYRSVQRGASVLRQAIRRLGLKETLTVMTRGTRIFMVKLASLE